MPPFRAHKSAVTLPAGEVPLAGGGGDADRSPLSLRFEQSVLAMSLPEKVLRRRQFDLGRLQEFRDNLAIIEADSTASGLPFRFAGAALCALLGREDLNNVDYLSVVAPSTRQSAYTSACAMVTYKCGLWQLTPVRTNDGETSFLEYTGVPVIGDAGGPGQIFFFVQHMGDANHKSPHIIAAQSATAWAWIDLGFGVPPIG